MNTAKSIIDDELLFELLGRPMVPSNNTPSPTLTDTPQLTQDEFLVPVQLNHPVYAYPQSVAITNDSLFPFETTDYPPSPNSLGSMPLDQMLHTDNQVVRGRAYVPDGAQTSSAMYLSPVAFNLSAQARHRQVLARVREFCLKRMADKAKGIPNPLEILVEDKVWGCSLKKKARVASIHK